MECRSVRSGSELDEIVVARNGANQCPLECRQLRSAMRPLLQKRRAAVTVQVAVRMATLRHTATLPDACSSHDPRLEPDLIRPEPQKSAPAKMSGRIPHNSEMNVNTSR